MMERMYKAKKIIKRVGVILIGVFFMVGCGNRKSIISQEEENKIYFEIVEMINQANYLEAEAEIENMYGMIQYDEGSRGFNKMNILRLCYIKQEKYDDAIDVLVEYIRNNNYLENWDELKEEPETFEDVRYAVNQIKGIIDLVSEEKRQEIIQYLGEDILQESN